MAKFWSATRIRNEAFTFRLIPRVCPRTQYVCPQIPSPATSARDTHARVHVGYVPVLASGQLWPLEKSGSHVARRFLHRIFYTQLVPPHGMARSTGPTARTAVNATSSEAANTARSPTSHAWRSEAISIRPFLSGHSYQAIPIRPFLSGHSYGELDGRVQRADSTCPLFEAWHEPYTAVRT